MFSKPYGTLTARTCWPDGTLIEETSQEIESYVENFLNLGSAVWGTQQVSGVVATNGTPYTLESGGAAGDVWRLAANAGADNYGLQIGSGTASESVTDTSLDTQLTTDVAYGTTTISAAAVSAPSATLDITRTFTNNTGGSLTVNEIGVVALHTSQAGPARPFLCLRDTGSPITTVPDGANTTIEYELEITV